jgi:D-beta-D-heptose 7-phosphate kinase/D-beta-D-heptose 1-phosphate adenosyltransferase
MSDYGKGVLAGDIPARLLAAARDAGRPVIVDTGGTDLERFAGADVAVLKVRALAAATSMSVATEAQVEAAAAWLRTAHGFGAVVVNRRAEGFCVVTADGRYRVPPGPGEPFNFTGAGDTAVAAIAASLAVGITLVDAVRIAALAVSVCASQTGMPVATAAELLAVLTPQGQVRRKIMPPVAAAAQIAHWRRAGLRTGLLSAERPPEALAPLRAHCDRLVLAMENPDEAALALAASLPGVDLVCPFEAGLRRDALTALRPDILLEPEAGEARWSRGGAGSCWRCKKDVLFFEKKKQKTFVCLVSRKLGQIRFTVVQPEGKSFLVLFFKKEHVLSYVLNRRAAAGAPPVSARNTRSLPACLAPYRA